MPGSPRENIGAEKFHQKSKITEVKIKVIIEIEYKTRCNGTARLAMNH